MAFRCRRLIRVIRFGFPLCLLWACAESRRISLGVALPDETSRAPRRRLRGDPSHLVPRGSAPAVPRVVLAPPTTSSGEPFGDLFAGDPEETLRSRLGASPFEPAMRESIQNARPQRSSQATESRNLLGMIVTDLGTWITPEGVVMDENGNDPQAPPDGGGTLYYRDGAIFYREKEPQPEEPNPGSGEKFYEEEGAGDRVSDERPLSRPQGGDAGVDCSRFADLDDPPPECRPFADDPAPPTNADTDSGTWPPPRRPDNTVTLQLSVGLSWEVLSPDLLDEIVTRVVTYILHTLTPFQAYYWNHGLPAPGPFARRGLRWSGGESNGPGGRFEREPETPSRRLDGLLGSSSSAPASSSSSASSLPVDLLYGWTVTEEFPRQEDGIFWYITKVSYAAFWTYTPPTAGERPVQPPRPIRRQDLVGNITQLCQSVVNETITDGIFLSNLEPIILDLLQIYRESAAGNSGDEETGDGEDSTTDPNGGDGSEGDGNDDQYVGVAIVGGAGGGEGSDGTISFGPGRPPPATGRIYEEPLELGFALREWVGLGLGAATLVASAILSVGAAALKHRHAKVQSWSAVLTEAGISHVLRVGWRYQERPDGDEPSEDEEEAEATGSRRWFLQVYDKTQSGYYNDDDSLLQGGVEKEEITMAASSNHSTAPISGNGTANSLAPEGRSSPSSSNGSHHPTIDASLPNSTSLRSEPLSPSSSSPVEPRSHRY